MGSEAEQEPVKAQKAAAMPSAKKVKRAVVRKSKPKKSAKRRTSKVAQAKAAPAVSAKPAPRPKARRKQTTKAERAKILAVAEREELTALQVQKRFGVIPVTYYSWRKASKKTGAKASPVPRASVGGVDIGDEVRKALRAQIAQLLPEIVRSEIGAALGGLATARRSRK